MSALEAINLEIARLDELRGSIPGLDADRWFALVLCRELLCSHAFNLRAIVRIAVKGIQQRVADRSGIRRATLSDYLNERSSLSADNVERVLRSAFQIKAGI